MWDLKKALEQQYAAEEAAEEAKKQREKHTDEVLSDISEEQSAIAFRFGLSKEALNSLLEEPEVYNRYLEVIRAEESNETIETPGKVDLKNPRWHRTQKTSPTSGTVFNTTGWDQMFNPKIRR